MTIVDEPEEVATDHHSSLSGHAFPPWNNASWTGNSWTRPDDEFEATALNYRAIRQYATAVLRAADARHIVPTPLDAIRKTLELTSVEELDALAAELPPRLLAKLKNGLFRRIRGFLAVRERIVYVDNSLRHSQARFVLGHELGHHVLPWQRDAYRAETDSTLTPNVRDRWEREANAFSAELLFNVDELKLRSLGAPLSLSTPVELHQAFDASLIATTRRFVEHHDASAALLFLGQHPTKSMGRPGTKILYGVQSQKFSKQFGAVIPGLRLSPAWPWDLHDLAHYAFLAVTRRGEQHVRGRYKSHVDIEFNFEIFSAGPYPFVLLTPRRRLSRTPRTRIVVTNE